MTNQRETRPDLSTTIDAARAAERSADRAFAAGDDAKAARLYRVAARAYTDAGMPGSAAIVADAATCCTRWG